MARKQTPPNIAVSPQNADDFRVIKGIGPALSTRLHETGIITYRQLASLTPTELAALVKGISAKKIAAQDWTGQARKLTSSKAASRTPKREIAKPEFHQHYENYTFEFLLDEKHTVRRTRVAHIQSGDSDTWAGWVPEALIDFLARHTSIQALTVPITSQQFTSAPSQESASYTISERVGVETPTSMLVPIPDSLPIEKLRRRTRPVLKSQEIVHTTDTVCIRSMEVITTKSGRPVTFLQHAQPYAVHLHIDLSGVIAHPDLVMICKASILSKQIGGLSHPMGEMVSALKFSENITLEINGINLPPGTYRPEAFIVVKQAENEPGLSANFKGNLLHVY
jgi:hypothetical protein